MPPEAPEMPSDGLLVVLAKIFYGQKQQNDAYDDHEPLKKRHLLLRTHCGGIIKLRMAQFESEKFIKLVLSLRVPFIDHFCVITKAKEPHPNSLICRDPAKYSQVVQSLKDGMGVIEIAVEQGLSKSTVQTIRERHRDILPCWKRRTAKALGDAGVALAVSIALGHEEIPWNQKALNLGILLSKKAELEGRGDVLRVVHTRIVSHGELLKRFSKFKTKGSLK